MALAALSRYRPAIFPAALITAYVGLWLAYPHQFNASDPWYYSLRAYHFAQHLDFSHVYGERETFDFRLAVTWPVALIYKLFGVSVITTHLWPLCAALALMVIVWAALPDRASKLFGLALCVTSVPLFDAATDLYPDVFAAAGMAACVLLLNVRHRHAARPLFWLSPVLAVACVFFAALAKESAYWIVPVWAYGFIADMRSDEGRFMLRRFYGPALAAAVVIGILYLVFNAAVWGDALARLKVMEVVFAHERAHTNAWWTIYSGSGLWPRLTYEPALLLYRTYGVAIVLAVLGCFVLPRQLSLWRVYAASCLLLFWFGSTNLAAYDPIPLYARYILPVLPALYLAAAWFASRLTVMAASGQSGLGRCLVIALVLIITAPPFAKALRGWRAIDSGEAQAMRLVKAALATLPEQNRTLVTADARSAEALAFYFSYDYPKNLTVIAAATTKSAAIPAGPVLLFANDERAAFLSRSYGETVYNEAFRKAGAPVLFKGRAVSLYATGRLGQGAW